MILGPIRSALRYWNGLGPSQNGLARGGWLRYGSIEIRVSLGKQPMPISIALSSQGYSEAVSGIMI